MALTFFQILSLNVIFFFAGYLLAMLSNNETFLSTLGIESIEMSTLKLREEWAESFYLSELSQKNSQKTPTKDVLTINPHFPCLAGASALGIKKIPVNTVSEVYNDERRIVCGVNAIPGSPIVYSIGGKGQTFELDFLKLRPDARIFMFVHLQYGSLLNSPEFALLEDPRIKYIDLGIPGYSRTRKILILAL